MFHRWHPRTRTPRPRTWAPPRPRPASTPPLHASPPPQPGPPGTRQQVDTRRTRTVTRLCLLGLGRHQRRRGSYGPVKAVLPRVAPPQHLPPRGGLCGLGWEWNPTLGYPGEGMTPKTVTFGALPESAPSSPPQQQRGLHSRIPHHTPMAQRARTQLRGLFGGLGLAGSPSGEAAPSPPQPPPVDPQGLGCFSLPND